MFIRTSTKIEFTLGYIFAFSMGMTLIEFNSQKTKDIIYVKFVKSQ